MRSSSTFLQAIKPRRVEMRNGVIMSTLYTITGLIDGIFAEKEYGKTAMAKEEQQRSSNNNAVDCVCGVCERG